MNWITPSELMFIITINYNWSKMGFPNHLLRIWTRDHCVYSDLSCFISTVDVLKLQPNKSAIQKPSGKRKTLFQKEPFSLLLLSYNEDMLILVPIFGSFLAPYPQFFLLDHHPATYHHCRKTLTAEQVICSWLWDSQIGCQIWSCQNRWKFLKWFILSFQWISLHFINHNTTDEPETGVA